MHLRAVALGVAFIAWSTSAPAASELPFDTSNQSPLIQIYGLPGIGAPQVLAPGEWRTDLHFEAANHLAAEQRGSEALFLDGETHRTTVKLYRGLRGGREIGIEIPYVRHGGGFFDSFIEGWHDFFGLPQNGRTRLPTDELLFRYLRDGVEHIGITGPTAGIGDVRVAAAQTLGGGTHALRLSVKLPTGDSAKLLGSGATDVALWLSTSCGTACTGPVSWYGGGGLLWMDQSDVLPELQQRLVAFGSAGLHWQALPRVTLGAQLDAHSPFYDETDLGPLADYSAQLVLGGFWHLHPRHALEVAVVEDIAVDTAPDVVIRIGLRSRF
jgi:hypothetical protein